MASGARWTIAIRIVERVIGFASTLILARLLSPTDFGVVAMGTAVHSILATLTEFGFTKALIRAERPRHADYSTAFTLHVIASALVAGVMLAAIPLAQEWYDDDRVALVLVALAAMSLVGGFRNLGLARYERALDFRPFFVVALARKATSFGIGVCFALIWHDYRALLLAMLLGVVAEVATTYRLTHFRPQFTLSKVRELLGFSLWWLASQAMTAFGRRGQDMLVGQHLGAATLGQYAVALDLGTMATTEIVAPVMRAVFPGYMQMRSDAVRLHAAFVRVWGGIALLALPSAAGTACLASLIIDVVLGPKWATAASLIGALALIGAVQALTSCYWPILLARTGPRAVFRLSAWTVALTIPAFAFVLWRVGLVAAIYAWIACAIVMLIVGARMFLRDLGAGGVPLMRALVRPAAGTLAMTASLLAVLPMLSSGAAWIERSFALVALIAFGAVIYCATVAALWFLAGRPDSAETDLYFVVRAKLVRGQSSTA